MRFEVKPVANKTFFYRFQTFVQILPNELIAEESNRCTVLKNVVKALNVFAQQEDKSYAHNLERCNVRRITERKKETLERRAQRERERERERDRSISG